MYTPTFSGTIENNKIKIDAPGEFGLWCLSLEGKKVSVTVKKYRKPRSTGKSHETGNQNGYYWMIVLPMSAKELGHSVEEMHEVFTEMYAPYTMKKVGDTQVRCKIRSSQMDTLQFSEFTDAIVQKMAEMGCVIPDPIK